jgi:hypothetical protein
MPKNEKSSLPDIVGVTSAVVVLDLLVRKINEFVVPVVDPHVQRLAGRTELGLFVSEHSLGAWHWVMLLVFGVGALLLYRCSLREVFLLPGESSWTIRKSLLFVGVVAAVESAMILYLWRDKVNFEWHWGIQAGNLISNGYEELAFRGFMFGMLLKWTQRPWYSMFVVTAIFMWHHGQYTGWESIGFFFFAFPFAFLTWKTRWLLWPYLLHVALDWAVDPLIVPGYVRSFLG